MSDQTIPKVLLWTSYILQGIIVVMFVMGAAMNLMENEEAVQNAVAFGYMEHTVFKLGVALLLSTILYAIPRTAVIGALFLTAWLGGAVATHVIHQDPVFNTVFPAIFGVVMWLALWLRDPRVRGMIK
ncbi:MAG: DoxX family protein [Cytophagales bacterium]|nr:DoxX family protein [Cytophagales bacterium]